MSAISTHVMGAALRLADIKPPDDKVTPGTWGFVVVASLAVATWLLLRSMTKHLGRVRFEENPTGEDASLSLDERAADEPKRGVEH